MNRKVVLFIAISLDGYIARHNGEVNWLYTIEGEGDNGYQVFYDTVDTVLMGRKTYDEALTLAEEFPYSDKTCYVFSRSEQQPNSHVTFVQEDIVTFVKELKEQPGDSIWMVGGADALDGMIKNQLVDEFIITIAPVLLGEGIPLFKEQPLEQSLTLLQTTVFGQFTQLHYKVNVE